MVSFCRFRTFFDKRIDRAVRFRVGYGMDIIRILAAIFLPPLGVFLQVGLGFHFWLNILLTLFGFVPGIIHAVWVILTKD